MRESSKLILVFLFLISLFPNPVIKAEITSLPQVNLEAPFALNQALQERRSIRNYASQAITINEVATLLWSAQGITNKLGYRTAPSAGALFPIELYLLSKNIETLDVAVYKYIPKEHALKVIEQGDKVSNLGDMVLAQRWVEKAPAVIVIAANYARTTKKYSLRGQRYVHMEVGHVAQNIYLQATALNLGTTIVGAFSDAKVKKLFAMDKAETPLALLPIGRL